MSERSTLVIEPLNIIADSSKKYKLKVSILECNYTIVKKGENMMHFPSIKLEN